MQAIEPAPERDGILGRLVQEVRIDAKPGVGECLAGGAKPGDRGILRWRDRQLEPAPALGPKCLDLGDCFFRIFARCVSDNTATLNTWAAAPEVVRVAM